MIQKYISSVLICFISTLLYNCEKSSHNYTTTEHYDLSDAQNGNISEIFDNVELIPLEFAGNSYPSSVNKLLVNDSIIFIVDNHDNIHLFSYNGNHISSSLEKQGEGPGEFPFSMGSTWNEHESTVEILTPYKQMTYDKYFNFIKEIRLPSIDDGNEHENSFFDYIYSLSDSVHLIAPRVKPFSLIVFNSNSNQLGKSISYAEDRITNSNMQTKNFFKINDSTDYFIPSALTYKIYDFNKNEISVKPTISFETGSNGITLEYINELNLNQNDLAFHLMSCDRDILLNTLPNTDHIITMLKNGNNLRNFYYVFIDRTSGKKTRISMYNGDHRNMPMFKDIDNEFAYATVLKEDLEEMPWLLLDKEQKSDSILGSIEDESLILLKYRFTEH